MVDSWEAGVLGAAGEGLAQVAGKSRPCWWWLTWIALTSIVKRVARALARAFYQPPAARGAG